MAWTQLPAEATRMHHEMPVGVETVQYRLYWEWDVRGTMQYRLYWVWYAKAHAEEGLASAHP